MNDPRGLWRACWATRAQFLNLGVIAGVWGVHVPSIKRVYALDARMLAVVLLGTSVGSVLMLFLAGRIVGRLGARQTSVVAGWMFCGAVGWSLVLPNVWLLLIAMLVLGSGESLYDVAINAEGTALEHLSGRAVMSGFHGMFSLGALAGSGAAATMLRAGVPAPTQMIGVGLVVATLLTLASRGMLRTPVGSDTPQAHFAWPRGALLLIGLLICSGMLAEGVLYNWSVLYVQESLHTRQERAALAYVAFAGATALMRFAGDRVRTHLSERTMLLSGSLLAAVAMGVVLLAARPWVAIAGFAAVGVGLATVVPLLYNAATRVPGVSRAAAIAAVSSIGYMGFMIGPPIVGGIAHATSLAVAMGTLIVASVLVAIGVRWVPVSDASLRNR